MDPRARSLNERRTLRRLTAAAAVTAAGVNVGLFLQTGSPAQAPVDVQGAIVGAFDTLLPGRSARPPQTSPAPLPSGSNPVATSRPS